MTSQETRVMSDRFVARCNRARDSRHDLQECLDNDRSSQTKTSNATLRPGHDIRPRHSLHICVLFTLVHSDRTDASAESSPIFGPASHVRISFMFEFHMWSAISHRVRQKSSMRHDNCTTRDYV